MAVIITLITAVAAGALAAYVVVRRETDALRQLLTDQGLETRKVLAEAVAAAQAAAVRAESAARPVESPAPVAAASVVVAAPVAPPPAVATQPVAPVAAKAEPIAAAPAVEEITPEILMVISAVVAAFFGKKAKVRRVRHTGLSHGGSVWAQQGRAFVQASHNLPVHR